MAAITVEQALQLAAAQLQAGQLGTAESLCRNVLAAQPHHAGAWHQLGTVTIASGRYQEAAECFAQAVAQSPGEGRYHCDLGVSYRLQEKLEDAVHSFARAVALQPDLPEAHLNLVEALISLGRHKEAIASGQQLLARRPEQSSSKLDLIFSETYNHLGNAFLQSRQLDEAIASYESALRLQPAYANAWSNLGIACFRAHQFERAEQSYRQAISLRPDFVRAHGNLALLLLLLGRYAEGWREQEWRLPSPSGPGPRWNGAPVPGQTLLVHAEQGFGDMLQFFRYLPLVKDRSRARVILFCQRELVRLFDDSNRGAEIIANDTKTALSSFDQQVPLFSLPLALNLPDPWHPPTAYLHANRKLRETWRQRLGSHLAFRVGLVWSGNPVQGDDASRSLTFEHLQPLLRLPHIDFYRLQIASHGADANLIDLTGYITDFADTAALMAELDLIITVDTAAAHLAGALGLPIWTLLSSLPAWRWGLQGEKTPWYPSMRFFRQKATGDWGEVIQRVAEALRAACAPSGNG